MNALTPIVAPTEAAILQSLEQHAEFARDAYAASTERALRDDVAKFSRFATSQGLSPMPAAPRTVVLFIDAMMAEDKKPASIRRYTSSVATFHLAAGVANPCQTLEVRLALRRMHRTHPAGRAQRQAAPLNRPILDQMLALPATSLRAKRDRALASLMYCTLARESEAVALRLSDVEFSHDGAGVVTIRRSKVDQEGAGSQRYIHHDTVAHLRAWLAAAGIVEGVLFRSVPKGGRLGSALAAPEVARILRRFAQRAGFQGRYSGHSLRVAAAQDAVAAGVDIIGVAQMGGWSSGAMPIRYSAKLAARRSGAARLAAIQGR